MEIFFALTLVVGKLVMDHIAVRRADKYAKTVVRYYD